MTDEFDEKYYQSGSERGTQYDDYILNAPKNRTYFEIAETINKIFKPARTLEIGCAIGVVVGHLETFDVEAYGSEISEWAVKNKVASNVIQSDGLRLPYEDNYFDVVYSIHALEHLRPESKDQVLNEISRVCRGFQWHLIPMLESGPYVGDRFGHLLNLRTDPTHNLLFEQKWWLEQFVKRDWVDTGVKLTVVHDNTHYELSDCQFLVAKQDLITPSLLRSAAMHNHKSAGALSLALNGRPGPGLDIHVSKLRGS